MKPWEISLIIICVLWLISFIRAGASVRYDAEGLKVWLRVGPVLRRVFPIKKKKPKKKEPKEKTAPEKAAALPEAKWKGGSLELAKRFLPLTADAAGRFQKKISIDDLELELTWGAEDPADAALGFGCANAALGMLWPLVENNFNVRQKRIGTSVDFNTDKPVIYIFARASLRVGQAVSLGVLIGFQALRLLWRYRKEQKDKGGAKHGKEPSHQ